MGTNDIKITFYIISQSVEIFNGEQMGFRSQSRQFVGILKGERIYEKIFIFGFNSNYAFMPNANHLGFCGIRYYG